MSGCVFVIDDNAFSRTMARSILERQHGCLTFASWREALPHATEQPPDLILLDILMPGEDGFAVIRQLKSDGRFSDIPVIFYTSQSTRHDEAQGLALGAVDFISKNSAAETMLARVNIHLELRRRRRHLEQVVGEKTRLIERFQDALMISLSDLVESRDADTAGHALRSVAYLRALLLEMTRSGVCGALLTPALIRDIIRAGPLYDVGMVGISDALIHKPGPLTGEEYEIVKQHALLGGKAIQRAIDATRMAGFLLTVRDMTLTHHERWDGGGYPLGLRGDQIPLAGRVTALVDVYDALRSFRPYRDALPHADAVEIIRRGRGTQFDPRIVDVFLNIHETFGRIAACPPCVGDTGMPDPAL